MPALLALAVTSAPASALAPKAVRIVSHGTGCTPTFCFRPMAFKLVSGTAVKWTNTTGAPHTVTRCTVAACGVSGGTGTDPGPNSPLLNPSGTYTLTFVGRGTYAYYCQVHGYATMHGKITVT